MSIKNQREFEGTQRKLALLEEQYDKAKQRPVENPDARFQTLRALKRMINQMKEEIVVYKAHATVGEKT